MEPQKIRAMARAKLASPEASNGSLAAIVGVTHPSVGKVLERAEVLELPVEDHCRVNGAPSVSAPRWS